MCDRRRHMASLRPGFHYSPVAHFLPQVSKDYLKLFKDSLTTSYDVLSNIVAAATFYWTQVRSLPCLVPESISALADFCSNCWISPSCYMDFPELLHGFVEIDIWISLLSCYMDLSKLIHGFPYSLSFYLHLAKLLCGFVKVVTGICPTVSMYFSPFA